MVERREEFHNAVLLHDTATGEPSSVRVSWGGKVKPAAGPYKGRTLTTTSSVYIPAAVFDAAAKVLGYTKRKGRK